MLDRFAAARKKVERANEHITNLNSIVDSLPERNISTVDIDPNTGNKFIKHFIPGADKLVVDMALILGDAIHNLRVAIEYAYAGAIERHVPPWDDHVQFPIRKDRQGLEAALNGRNIKARSPRLFDAMVSQIKPYEIGGNEFFGLLHDLDIADKHWLLIPLMQQAVVLGIIVEDKEGHDVSGDSWAIRGNGPYFFIFSRDTHIENNGKLSASIVFNDGTILNGSPVPSLLDSFSNLALYTIKILESL